jgi:hypothetical protein
MTEPWRDNLDKEVDSVPVQYTNRRGQTYFLHRGTTRAGRPNYYFSLKPEGDLADAIPAGYEVYEHPAGQVHLRKVQPQIITNDEKAVVEREVNRHPHLKGARVDVKGKIITVYVPNQAGGHLVEEMLADIPGARRADLARILERDMALSPDLRFVLVDDKQRIFAAQRYCYLGSINDWIEIGERGCLLDLVKRYVKHLLTESWFELY